MSGDRRGHGGPGATEAADAAVKSQRQLERVYQHCGVCPVTR